MDKLKVIFVYGSAGVDGSFSNELELSCSKCTPNVLRYLAYLYGAMFCFCPQKFGKRSFTPDSKYVLL